ncbi:hypothetical protein DP939_18835 [Spongiactinospora rosea]|uniref:Uncharacterized protein n=1 Tax=Spongiactinospora rosea TaxID=2248750 RepID=A0A366LX76_9ACTN|nr:hypothetical protein [Spongiactinospora rosea]RBQ18555.1 hypothetical protein DP939_18835 [Spongiactinospora rosea]
MGKGSGWGWRIGAVAVVWSASFLVLGSMIDHHRLLGAPDCGTEDSAQECLRPADALVSGKQIDETSQNGTILRLQVRVGEESAEFHPPPEVFDLLDAGDTVQARLWRGEPAFLIVDGRQVGMGDEVRAISLLGFMLVMAGVFLTVRLVARAVRRRRYRAQDVFGVFLAGWFVLAVPAVWGMSVTPDPLPVLVTLAAGVPLHVVAYVAVLYDRTAARREDQGVPSASRGRPAA